MYGSKKMLFFNGVTEVAMNCVSSILIGWYQIYKHIVVGTTIKEVFRIKGISIKCLGIDTDGLKGDIYFIKNTQGLL